MAHSGGATTPVKRSSASQSSEPASNHLLRMGPLVADEIRGTVYSGFNARSFIDSLYPVCDSAHAEALIDRTFDVQSGRWKSWPKEPTEQAVIQWLKQWTKRLVEVFGAGEARSRVRNSGHVPLFNGSARRKPDVIFIARNLSLPCSENRDQSCTAECEEEADYCTVCAVSWDRVRVVGELKQNAGTSGSQHQADHKMVLTIAHRVREIFGTQPGRRYVHAFSLCGSLLRCFLFDRSGVFASEHFDIHSKPELTVRVFAAYLYGSPDWTGFDPTIQVVDENQDLRTYDPTAQDRGDPFVKFVEDGNTTRLYLDPKPLFLQPTIASRGSVCWRARRADSDRDRWEFVVKDQWRSKQREHEGVHLQRLEGVKGVAQRVHHEDVMVDGQRDDTADAIRRGLNYKSPSVTEVVMPSNYAEYQLMAEGTGSLSNSLSSSAATLPTRPPPPALHHHNLRNKRSHSSIDNQGSHSSIDNQRSQTPKRRRNDTCESAPTSVPYNRIHGRLVLRGVGRRLKEFKTREELLLAFRSAIVGYRNMLGKNILHRDVSVNNIMISSPDPGGYLIDLDFAVPLDRRSASGAPHRTGTPEFMAIDVLEGCSHAPRHDLESFFYVLIWMYTHYPVPGVDSPEPPKFKSPVRSWSSGSYKNMARQKRALHDDMYLSKEYLPGFYEGWRRKSTWVLAVDWWELLFQKSPDVNAAQKMRTMEHTGGVKDEHPSPKSEVEKGMQLSEKMIAALDKAVETLRQEEVGDGKGA
ncbi:hypothetical protein EX30DRAFT_205453 [Ascodesmis nigricans]|uniref:non-specific serine/threonine protein kinase n=1 Tax=Ascodesmis nigricans TaxID=341454 RepID=A0A4S2MPU2_9PEZI|nr:hypothetical protein EX30DRAFT_205453 [Ascodesmis nigricans]